MTVEYPRIRRKTSIHRILILRLTITAIAISVIFGVAAYISDRNIVGEIIMEIAGESSQLFNAKITYLLENPSTIDKEAIQRELDAFAAIPVKHRSGRFVLADVYNPKKENLARSIEHEYEHIKTVEKIVDSEFNRLSGDDAGDYRFFRIERIPHCLVSMPLTNSKGERAGNIQGVFVVSESVLSAVRYRILRTIGAVIGIVLATAALLYPVIVNLLRKLTKVSLQLLDSNLEIQRTLGSAIAKRDSDTDAHNYRVTIIAIRFAEALGLDRTTIQSLIKGAFLHDVGKIGISDAVLWKPGRLNENEFQTMKTHVNHGLDIVQRSEWLSDAKQVVGHHHEKYDGSGYMIGLSGEEIPITARIFAIADVFDALASKRPYKEPFSFEETMEILEKGKGSHFDPGFLDTFNQIATRLYDELAGREDASLKEELDNLTNHYFAGDFDLIFGSKKHL